MVSFKECYVVKVCFFIFMLLITAGFISANELTIIYTAETHGMIDQCDCPKNPDGGIFRRATLVDDISSEMNGNILVLDGGGSFAGGIDDQYTMGDELDRERTLINLRGMSKMGYAAVCLGEDEFRFGINFLNTVRADARIPFLSCNIFYRETGGFFAEPNIIKRINGIDVAVIGVTTPDLMSGEYSGLVKSLVVEDPVTQVEKYVNLLREKADIIVLLSHLGDDNTKKLVKKVRGLDIVLNAHRWKKADFHEKIKDTHIVQFNYQGKKIARIDLTLNKKKEIINTGVQEVVVSPEIIGDPELTGIVTDFRENVELAKKKKVKLDLYVMSYCPYGLGAERIIFPLTDKFMGKIDLNLYYIVSKTDGAYTSLHGNEELDENLRQICVKMLKPEKILDYIRCVNKSEDTEGWKECLVKTGITFDELNECISSGEGERELKVHYLRKQRLRVEGSPTVYVNNRRFKGGFSNDMSIRKELCSQVPDSDQLDICKNLPECFSDSNCLKTGYIGTCKDAGTPSGKCVYIKDQEFTFTVLVSRNAFMTNEVDIINSTKSIFPGMKLNVMEIETQEGKKFREKYKINRLPAYIFESSVQEAHNFKNVKGSFIKEEDGYLIAPEAVGATLDITRERIPGKIMVFISSFSEQANEVLVEIIDRIRTNSETFDIEFHYLAFLDEAGNITTRRGIGEIEENIRQLVVKKYFPDKFFDYVLQRAKIVGSTYWEDAAVAAELDPTLIKKLARSPEGEKLLEEDINIVKELQIGGDVVFFVNNQEVIYLKSPGDLQTLLKQLKLK